MQYAMLRGGGEGGGVLYKAQKKNEVLKCKPYTHSRLLPRERIALQGLDMRHTYSVSTPFKLLLPFASGIYLQDLKSKWNKLGYLIVH